MERLKILDGLHRYRLDRHISSLLMAIAIGILSGYGAVLFRFVIQGAQYVFYQSTEDILTFVPTKAYQSLVFCSPDLEQGTTYTVYSGGSSTGTATDGLYTGGKYSGGTEVVSFTISSVVTNAGSSAGAVGFNDPAAGGAPGGGRGVPR